MATGGTEGTWVPSACKPVSQSSKSWSHQESGSTLSKPFNQAAPRTANEEEVEGGWGMVGGGVAEVAVRRQTNNCCSRKSGSGSGERNNSVKGEHHGGLVDGETLWEEVKNLTRVIDRKPPEDWSHEEPAC